MKAWLRTYWPHVFGSTVVAAVGLPAAVASYRHGITIATQNSSDPVMDPWLPMTTDGLLLASLVVIWVRRLTARRIGLGPVAAFVLGLLATLGTNLAAAKMDNPILGVAVALWPPVTVAIVLELVALIVVPDRGRTVPVGGQTGPTDTQTDRGPAVDQRKLSDDQIVAEVRRLGIEPTRKALHNRYGVGSGRADRIKTAVEAPVHLVQPDETATRRNGSGP